MAIARITRISGIITLLITIFSLSLPAYAKYSGGIGEPNDPYQIATAEDLMLLGDSPEDYDKHLIMTADIDLDPNLPGRKVFDDVMINPNWVDFTGVFNGNDHAISNLTFYNRTYQTPSGLFSEVKGSVKNLRLVKPTGHHISGYPAGLLACSNYGTISNCHIQDCNFSGIEVGGLVQSNSGTIIDCHVSGQINAGGHTVGGLVGRNRDDGTITRCSFSGSVVSEYGGGSKRKGGLVGVNQGGIAFCYSTGFVAGGATVGGLVGESSGVVYCCYSTCAVSGGTRMGGLVGTGGAAKSFWDIETSGLMSSSGETGLTTAEMKMAKTFLDAGWDFLGETANGTEDIWWILEGQDYPKLVCDYSLPPWAFWPNPHDAATDVNHSPILSWHGGRGTLHHDVFFGDDKEIVAKTTTDTPEIYKGRQAMEMTTFNPAILEWGKTYSWRIDEVNEADPCSPWKGKVWSFTTADYIITFVVDDFESYTNNPSIPPFLIQTWICGRNNGTSSDVWPFPEQNIVHNGRHSMLMTYTNLREPWYSEIERTWETPQDWTVDSEDTLTLYFHGQENNSPDPLYVCIEDSTGLIAVVICPVPNAVQATQWKRWDIDLADIRSTGVDLSSVQKMYIGIGDPDNPEPGGTGRIYIDDIWLTFRNLILDEF